MARNQESDYPMRFLASDCDELFQEISNASVGNQRKIVSQTVVYRDAFAALTSFLCIFNEPDVCLGYRLRKHESIQDIMIRLLELLRQNLFAVSVFVLKTESDLPLDVGSEVAAALQGIKDSLKSLNKFAMTFKQSSRSSALTLARNFATSKRHLEDLEELILIALETLYPKAAESLRQHICNTLTDRYARLEYSAYMRGASHPKPPKQHQDIRAITLLSEHEPAHGSSTVSRSETVEFDHFQNRTQSEFNSRSSRKLSIYDSDSRLHEPKAPIFKAGEGVVQCSWCNDLLDESVLWNNRWTDIGRLHYRRDLKPFPCLSESCGESRPSFSSRKQWLEHMRLEHSTTWPQTLHAEVMWVCHDHDRDGENIPYTFSSKDDLEQHMLLIHLLKKPLSEIEFTEYLEERPSLHGTMSSSPCPLCFSVVENSLEVKESSSSLPSAVPMEPSRNVKSNREDEKQETSCVSLAADDEATSYANAGDHKDYDSSTLFALELHIAAHLQYLLVISLRLMETLGHDIDGESLTGLDGLKDLATASVSSMNDTVGLNARSSEELELVHMSDSEQLQKELMRLNGEAAEDVLPSYGEDQWDFLDILAKGPTEEDSILQNFSKNKKTQSRRKFVERLRQTPITSHDESAEGYRWTVIGLLQVEIFNGSKDLHDLSQAIEAFTAATGKLPSDNPVLEQSLADLSSHLSERYGREPHADGLVMAIEVAEKVTEANDNTQQLLDHYVHLSGLFRSRYLETGTGADLRRAVEIARQVLRRVPEGHARQAKCHNNLGQLLVLEFRRTGIETTLDEALDELALTIEYVDDENMESSEYLAALSGAQHLKSVMSRSTNILNDAIKLMRLSISQIDIRGPAFPRRLSSLGAMLGELYTMSGAADALEESIQVGRTVLSSAPEDHMDAIASMIYLADRLEDMFRMTGDLGHFEEAVYLSTTAIALCPENHPACHVSCHRLAYIFFERFHGTGSIEDLDRTIAYCRKAVDLLPHNDVNMAMYKFLLADALVARYDFDFHVDQLYEAHHLYVSALSHVYSALEFRLQAGRKLFELKLRVQNWDGAYNVAKMTLGCVSYLPIAELADIDKLLILQTTGWIASEGVAAALNAGRPLFEVLSFLENSRWLEGNYGDDCSEAFGRLRQAHPSKLDEFLAIRTKLTRPVSFRPPRSCDNSPWNALSEKHGQATRDCERILTEIRNEPGFSNWPAHEDEARILQAGAKGPVIVLTASPIRSDAIIIYRDRIEVVNLPGLLNHHHVAEFSVSRRVLTVATLLWIWETISEPILANLDFSPAPSEDYLRLWLIPTGLMRYLPIHTSGDYRTSESISLLDFAVCSYSPSINTLILAREKAAVVPEDAKALLATTEGLFGFQSDASVNIREPVFNSDLGELRSATKEISTIQDICQSRGLDLCQSNRKEGVLLALASCTLFHFAGRLVRSRENPLKSQLLLADGSITVMDIIAVTSRLFPPFLAYFSECGLAKTLEELSALEPLNPAGTLNLAGFRHVIGSLGEPGVVDHDLYGEIPGLFYTAWAEEGLSDDAVALSLHHATLQCKNRMIEKWSEDVTRLHELGTGSGSASPRGPDGDLRNEEKSVYWARFVHFGP